MVKSMTGFGRGEYLGAKKKAIVEIKSVNHRYGETVVKLPRQYTLLEDGIKRYLSDYIARGRIEVVVKLEDAENCKREVQVDKGLAEAYYRALKELAAITGTFSGIEAYQLAQLPDVLVVEEKEDSLEDVWQDVRPALRDALSSLLEMRTSEGEKLKKDLEEHLRCVKVLHTAIAEQSPEVVKGYKGKLQERLNVLLDNEILDENRLALEITLFADRCCIDEELVRLDSHLAQFRTILAEENPIGRKLDFLVQEMNREINTIGSKANDLKITQHVLEIKNELEKIREQVQNIE